MTNTREEVATKMSDDMRKAFAVKHYNQDDNPIIKYDGGHIQILGDRQDAEDFLAAIYQAAQADAKALVEELVAKLRYLENANEVFIDSVGVDPYQHIQDISDGIDEALTKAQAWLEGK